MIDSLVVCYQLISYEQRSRAKKMPISMFLLKEKFVFNTISSDSGVVFLIKQLATISKLNLVVNDLIANSGRCTSSCETRIFEIVMAKIERRVLQYF